MSRRSEVDRQNRLWRSRSVEDGPNAGFNVFGKGIFELDDYDTDSAGSSPMREGRQWNKGRNALNNEYRREEPVFAVGRPADRRLSMVKPDLHHNTRFKTEFLNTCLAEKERKQRELSDIEEMKEKFAKLLLGEDLSGGKKGVSSALALSNAITNLSASIVGELWKLEPLAPERKAMWRKEMDWFLSVVDHIVEFVPSYQNSGDGPPIEVMVMKPRSDLQINIPALRKLEAMLFDCLDGFVDTEFWYADRSVTDSEKDMFTDIHRQKDKWWLPIPRVPANGLSGETRKNLQVQKESVNQILKAALAINSQVLSEMEIPDSYWESFPKNGREILGDVIYRHITSENFYPEALLSSLDLSSDHSVLDSKNRIEAALAIWRRKIQSKDAKRSSISSWGPNNDEKREVQAERAEAVLTLLKLRFPGLPQTVLDMSKIQYNKDVGQSALESYSRVLESLASNILSRIDDVLYADDMIKRQRSSAYFSRSASYADSVMTSIFEDQSSHAYSPLPSPRSRAFTSPSSRIEVNDQHPKFNAPAMNGNNTTTAASATEKPPSMDRSQSTRTLSEYIGWQLSQPAAPNGSESKLSQSFNQEIGHSDHHGFKNVNENAAHVNRTDPVVKKAPLVSNTLQKRHYWSYMEGLEKIGFFGSPSSWR